MEVVPELVICALFDGELAFADDEKTLCAGCGRTIVFRPYSKPIKMKICVHCAYQKMVSEGVKPNFMMNPAAVDDLRLFWGKTDKGVH